MANTITITNKVWNGTSITFNWSYVADIYAEQKLIEWSVGGVIKGSALGDAFIGSGSGSFAYSSTADSVEVIFKLYRWFNGAKGIQISSNIGVIFTKTTTTTPPPPTTTSLTTQTSTVLPAPPTGYYVTTQIRNPSYVQTTSTRRTFKFDLDYSVYLTALLTVDGIIYIQYSVNGVNTKLTQIQTRLYQNGTINILLTDDSPYVEFSGNTVKAEVFVWGTNAVPWSQNISTTQSLPSTATLPVTPVLSVTPIDKYNFILSWTGNVTDQFNLERATSTLGYSSLFGDLQDTDNQVNTNIPAVTETYYYRIRTKNSVGYSNYSNVITVINTEPTPEPPPPPPPTVTIPGAPILQMLVSSDPLAKLLKWNIDNNVTSYNIESSNPLTDPLWMSLTGDLIVGTSLGTNNDLGDQHWGIRVTMGTQDGLWKYRIRAQNSVGYSNYSNIVSYTISNNIPEPPPPTTDNKNLLSILTRVFAMGTGLGLLIKK